MKIRMIRGRSPRETKIWAEVLQIMIGLAELPEGADIGNILGVGELLQKKHRVAAVTGELPNVRLPSREGSFPAFRGMTSFMAGGASAVRVARMKNARSLNQFLNRISFTALPRFSLRQRRHLRAPRRPGLCGLTEEGSDC